MLTESSDNPPPFTHNLSALAGLLELELTEENSDFLDLLTRYYITNRYPEVKQHLARPLTAGKSKELIERTRQFIKWLRSVSKM